MADYLLDSNILILALRRHHRYARQGVQLSFPDAVIAATALQRGLTLVTTNTRHFPMPEIQLQPVAL